MNRIAFGRDGEIRPYAVAVVGLVLSALALAIDMLIAAAASAVGAPELGVGRVLLSSVPAVLGNALGFYASHRSYSPRSLAKFLVPAAGFFVLFMIPPVWGLVAGGTVAAFAVAAVLNAVPVAIAVTVLLGLRPETRPGIAPELAPSNA